VAETADSDVALKEIDSVVFAGFVSSTSIRIRNRLKTSLQPVRQLIEDLAIGEMHHYWWKSDCRAGLIGRLRRKRSSRLITYRPPIAVGEAASEVIYGIAPRRRLHFMHRNVEYGKLSARPRPFLRWTQDSHARQRSTAAPDPSRQWQHVCNCW